MPRLEELSFAAIALYTYFEDGYEADSLHTREVFHRSFPESSYEDALDELMNAGMYPEAGEPYSYGEPKGILFTQRSARPIVID